MRKNGRVDANQALIVRELRQAGCSVAVTSDLGGGFPDLVVARRGKTVLVEIKDPNQPPSKRKLTQDETQFHACWNGEIVIAETADELLRKI